MITYIKSNWKGIFIAVLIAYIALSGIISNCTGKQVDTIITQADVDTKLNKQKTDLELKFYTVLDDTLKKVQDEAKRKSDNLKPRIIYKKAKAETLVAAARKDTNTTALSDSAMNAQEEAISDMSMKANSDSIQLSKCGERLIVSDSAKSVLKRSCEVQERINTDLNTALIKANKGKSTKWWFLGVGAILGVLISR